MDNRKEKNIALAFGWKLFERLGVQGTQFVIQLVLARLLDPEHYGELAIMVIFTSLANVFIQAGFSTSLIQNKDVTEEDYSSVLWVSLGVAALLYGMIYFAAPVIAVFYNMPGIVAPLRVIALMLLPGALNSIQLARISREMDFKKVFYSNVAAVLLSGAAGIIVALLGGGLWALVIQSIANVFVACFVMSVTSGLRIRWVCNLNRVKVLFAFGWKLLVSSLIDTLHQDLRSLAIGKKFNLGTLGYYNRGKQFPQFIINAVNGAVQSVMLPAMSALQDNRDRAKELMRNSIMLSSYILFPMMAGLAGVATSMVRLLLTDKWLPCVPYLQIYCFSMAFYPVHSCNLQAINAMGRSDIFLKLEILKKAVSISFLVVAVICFDSPIAIAMTGVAAVFSGTFINAFPNKKLIGYSYLEQVKDILPSFGLSVIMLVFVLMMELLQLPAFATLILQMLTGVVLYVALSVLFRVKPFMQLLKMMKSAWDKKRAV